MAVPFALLVDHHDLGHDGRRAEPSQEPGARGHPFGLGRTVAGHEDRVAQAECEEDREGHLDLQSREVSLAEEASSFGGRNW